MDAAVQIPARLEDRTTVLKDLKRLETYLQGVKKGSLLVLAENKIFDSGSTYVGIHEYLGMIRFVSVSQGDRGFFLEFNEQGRILRFIEGDIEFDMNATGKTIGQTAKMPPKGSGTEITFHPTGYPATYKTSVKGNLFGRQMEWNDKGEVISDIDLDIPTAQKQKEKPVMRTWTSRGGKYTLQAKYISADENQVVLETEKDGEVVVKLSELSDEDRDYVKKQRE